MARTIRQLDIHPFYGQVATAAKGLRKILYHLIPLHTFSILRTEWHLAWVRLRTRNALYKYFHVNDVLLNLGAGNKGRVGWINVDAWPAPQVNCLYDCRKSLPFPDNSARAIFSEHFLEHLDYTEEVPCFLSECHRVLKHGGVIRIVVPDAEKYVHAYCQAGWEAIGKMRSLGLDGTDPYLNCKYNTKMELLNVLFRQGHEHKYAYDYETIGFLLKYYGFSNVQRKEYGQSMLKELAIDQPRRASESLYVEAAKP